MSILVNFVNFDIGIVGIRVLSARYLSASTPIRYGCLRICQAAINTHVAIGLGFRIIKWKMDLMLSLTLWEFDMEYVEHIPQLRLSLHIRK